MGSPRASLIIRCYNEREHIGKLLHGIFQQRTSDFEVILVDSGSTDGTLEVAQQYPIEEIVYIDPSEFSFGRALNYGCQAANGDYYVFASAHVYPRRRDWLDKLLEKFDDDSQLALVYGKQRGEASTKFSEKRIFNRWFPANDIDSQRTPFCNNANAAIRSELWEEYPYDEKLTGLEDLDWAKRVQEDGYEISYASEAEIVHVHDESPRQVLNRYRREALAHKQIMSDQKFSFWDFLSMFAKNTVADYRASLVQGDFIRSLWGIPQFRLMQFWGTYRGFQQDNPVSDRLWRRFYYPDKEELPGEGGSGSGERTDDLYIDYST